LLNPTFVHTCDLCGADHPRGDLRRLGKVEIEESQTPRTRQVTFESDTVDVCPACRARPISEVIALLDDKPDRDRFGNPVERIRVQLA
jgi:hypothetical protein